MRFVVGGTAAATAGLPPSIVRAGEAAVTTGDHAVFDFARWVVDFWVNVEAWMKVGGLQAGANLWSGQNAELAAIDSGGTLRFTPRFHLLDMAGADHVYSLANLTLAAGWNYIRLLQDLEQGKIGAWLGGTLVGSSATFGSGDSGRISVQRWAWSSILQFDTEMAIDTSPTAAGSVVFDNVRMQAWRSGLSIPYALTNLPAPTGHFTDLGSPALFVWGLRETSLPHLIDPRFGRYSGIPRLSAYNDRYAGPWSITPAAIAVPVP